MSVVLHQSLAASVRAWFDRFARVSASGDRAGLKGLFVDDCHWRDALALTWHLGTTSGVMQVVAALMTCIRESGAHGFQIDRTRTPPQRVHRIGRDTIEVIFRFETAIGGASGVVRLVNDDGDGGDLKAWTLFTSLESLKGFEERLGATRPTGQSHSRDFRGPNWLDQRRRAATYLDHDPVVLVIGGGQAGLSVAARLKMLDVDALIIEREPRIGNNWRNRYHALTLHNQVQVNHLPYLPFPDNWPTYIPKDKIAGWFEAYVEVMELNVWAGADFIGGDYDAAAQRWTANVRKADGSVRTVHPRHIVMATGVSDMPNLPEIPSLSEFKGTVVHSSRYEDGEAWSRKQAVVIGTGNSGHDIAHDLHSSGAQVTLVQRSPTMVVSIEPSGQLGYALYDEGPPLADCDLIASSTPTPLGRRAHQMLTERCKVYDRALHEGLTRAGFELDFGEDNTGWQYKYLTRGGGYYFNVGCSELIIERKVALTQFRDIDRFEGGGMRLRGGALIPADLVVLATGYLSMEHLLRKLFGERIADRVGPIWGFGDGMELRNMYVRTPQPGLWFIAGSLAQCRINSKYLALQIKACEEGMIALTRP